VSYVVVLLLLFARHPFWASVGHRTLVWMALGLMPCSRGPSRRCEPGAALSRCSYRQQEG